MDFYINVDFLKYYLRDFPGGPVVKTLPSNAGCAGLIPGQGAKIPHAWRPRNQHIKQKQYCNKLNKNFKNGPHPKKKMYYLLTAFLATPSIWFAFSTGPDNKWRWAVFKTRGITLIWSFKWCVWKVAGPLGQVSKVWRPLWLALGGDFTNLHANSVGEYGSYSEKLIKLLEAKQEASGESGSESDFSLHHKAPGNGLSQVNQE